MPASWKTFGWKINVQGPWTAECTPSILATLSRNGTMNGNEPGSTEDTIRKWPHKINTRTSRNTAQLFSCQKVEDQYEYMAMTSTRQWPWSKWSNTKVQSKFSEQTLFALRCPSCGQENETVTGVCLWTCRALFSAKQQCSSVPACTYSYCSVLVRVTQVEDRFFRPHVHSTTRTCSDFMFADILLAAQWTILLISVQYEESNEMNRCFCGQ